jgi:acetyl-CoA carboxylase carboxyl transferase subunit alpha
MSHNALPFEQHIVALETKIEELKALADSHLIDLSAEITTLTQKLEAAKKETYSNLSPWEVTQVARHHNRPFTLDYINNLCEEFVELHGGRQCADDDAIVGGFAQFRGQPVVVLGHQKGRDTTEKIARNFGMPHPEGYRKALRFMKLADKFDRPIFCFVDTPGAYPGVEAEERGQAEAIARNIFEMANLKVPVIVVIIGEGGSGGAVAIAVGNTVLMLQNSIYSVISPEGCASILWRDVTKAEDAAKALKITSNDLLELGVIDEIIPEPTGGAHRNWDFVFKRVGDTIAKHLKKLQKMSGEELYNARMQKYRKIGVIVEES